MLLILGGVGAGVALVVGAGVALVVGGRRGTGGWGQGWHRWLGAGVALVVGGRGGTGGGGRGGTGGGGRGSTRDASSSGAGTSGLGSRCRSLPSDPGYIYIIQMSDSYNWALRSATVREGGFYKQLLATSKQPSSWESLQSDMF